MNNLTQGLIREGHNVDLLAINTAKHFTDARSLPPSYVADTNIETVFVDTAVKPIPALLNLFGRESYNISRFWSEAFENKLIEKLKRNQYDVIQLESLFVTMYISAIRKYSKAKIVLRAHNIEYKIWERNAGAASGFLKRKYFSFLAGRLKSYELSVLPLLDGIAAITPEDAQWFKEHGFKKTITLIPFGFDLYTETGNPLTEDKASVFHIGAMDWQPNIEGIDWFLREVWPKVLNKHPKAVLYLAGRKMNAELLSLKQDNVVVTGEVEDAHGFIRSKGLMIVPLLSGGGMRVKLIEGMALGKVVVSTSVGAEGVEATPGENILIADTSAEFADAVCRYLKDAAYLESIGRKAKQFVAEHYNNSDISKKLAEFYRTIIQ
jgi:glycosyltransferase involved in cell wall biosynthesis